MRILPAALGAFFVATSFGHAGVIGPLMKKTARQILHEGAPGVSIAVIANGQTYFYNAGTSERPHLPVTNHTLFETASITKVFTTTLLGIDVVRRDKALNDRIGKYLPGHSLRPEMRRATLRMLGTFTAGLPEAPPDYSRLPASQRGVNHYPVSRFLRFVDRFKPATRLPAPRSYADASVGLLGLCLGGLHLGTWEQRLKTEIFIPLGMNDTALRLTPGQEQRLARGCFPDGRRASRWPTDAMAPSDGVKSTTYDLARFLSAELGENDATPDDLQAGMEVATRTGFMVRLRNGREFQALAWRALPIIVGNNEYWITTKSGDVPGFSSKISFSRRLGIGVAILTNVSRLNLANIEFDLIKGIAAAH